MQAITTETWFLPTNYRTLRVKKTTYRSLMYYKRDNYERLTWLSKATSNTFFIRIKKSIFPSTKAICDLDDSPDVL